MNCKNFLPGATPNWSHYEVLKTAVRDSIRKLKIEDMGEVDITCIREFDFDLNTKPGYRYENYLLKQSKKEALDDAVFLAEERYSKILEASKSGRIINRKEIIPGVYSVGARNKREDEPVVGENAVSRPVHMPEFHVELHGGIFSDILTTHIKEKEIGPIFIGNSFLKGERLGKLLKDNYYAVEGDWKKFDASLCNVLITLALCICRLYFPDGVLYDNHFLAVLDSLIIKDYHLVGGKVYRLLHGLPSGSKWTSLLGSIINLVVLNHVFSSVKYYDRSFAIGGDDFVTFIKEKKYCLKSIKKDALIKADQIGMVFKIFKEKYYKHSKRVEDYPVFYKYTYFNDRAIIPTESILERVFSPWNKKYNSNFEVLNFLDNLLPSLGYPTTSSYFFYLFYIYVYYRQTGKSLTVDSLVKRHFSLYFKMKRCGTTIKELRDVFDINVKNKRNIFVNEPRNRFYLLKLFVN